MSDNKAPKSNEPADAQPASDADLNKIAGGRMKLDPLKSRSGQVSDASLDDIAGGRAPRRGPDPV